MAPELVVDFERRFPTGATIAATLRVDLRPGTILVLFGPSGSGKTTVVRCIAGLDRPTRGTVAFGDSLWVDTARGCFEPPQSRRIGYVFQDPALFPHLSVRANVAYGLRGPAAAREARVSDLLELLAIGTLADRRPRELSGGQAQRVALARALAPAPRLLLLDEPFAALDTPTRTALRGVLRSTISRLGASAVLVTHDRNEAIALGDALAVLADGHIRQVGPVLEVFRRPADLAVARSVGMDAVLAARVVGVTNGLIDLQVQGATLRAADVRGTSHDGSVAAAAVAPQAEVFACIRSEDVALERSVEGRGSARNHLPGRVIAIEHDGALDRVTVDCGFSITSLITRHAREELALRVGDHVTAAIKATAIHLVPKA